MICPTPTRVEYIWPESFDKQAFQEHMGVILHDTNVFITRMEERLGGPYFSF